MSEESDLGEGLPPGSKHHRAFVDFPEVYDLVAATQFCLLISLGLREHHFMLNVGAGSLRGGRLFIPYLLPGRYFGIEPEEWLIEEGLRKELGKDIVRLKRPTFSYDHDFTLSTFGRKFDFVLAQAIFTHASQTQILRCLSEAGKVMGPQSQFVANFGQGDEDYQGEEWVYPGVINYTLEHMQELVERVGMVGRTISWPHPAGGLTWMVITQPGHENSLEGLEDVSHQHAIMIELQAYKDKLSRLEAHPYARLGKAVNYLIQRLTLRRVSR